MKRTLNLLFLIGLILTTSITYAQEFEIVSIKTYANETNSFKAKKPREVELILDLPNITLYRIYKSSTWIEPTGIGYQVRELPNNDTYWLALRPGEEYASYISWDWEMAKNKNMTFRRQASKYFKDYPELSRKIKNKEYIYSDLFDVVKLYDEWKSKQ